MKTKLILSVLTLSVCFKLLAQQSKFPDINTEFPLLWKVQMGNTTYRTNVLFTKEDLIIGSNGENYRDFYLDEKSGVYVIDRTTGKIKTSFAGEDFGDMDVNGVLLHNNLLYFGNDNEEILCTDLKGNIKWRKATSGDIEHEMVMINNKGNQYLVYGTETGEARAIRPGDGSTVWTYYIPEFTGWKPNDSRFVFKVQAYFSNSEAFFTKPMLSDVNKDGVNDLIYNLYYGSTLILNGANGKELTKIENTLYDKSEAFISHKKTNPIIMQVSSHTDVVNSKKGGTTYITKNKINCYNVKGKLLKAIELKSEYLGTGLNSLELANGELVIPFQDSLLIIKKDGVCDFINKTISCERLDWEKKKITVSRNSSDPIIANRTFAYAGNPNCVAVLNQNDELFLKTGFIEVISLDTKKVIKRLQLPSSSEFAPVIEDVNKDGRLDLLVNCRDGNLYCFDLKVPLNGNQKITASR